MMSSTPFRDRLPALRAYVKGEKLCDESRVDEGMRQLGRAYKIAHELESEEWPTWAMTLYDELVEGRIPVDPPVPMLLNESTEALQPRIAGLYANGQPGTWWSTREAGQAVCDALGSQHFAVLDGFLDEASTADIRTEIATAWGAGLLGPASTAEAGDIGQGRQRDLTRRDDVAWIEAAQGNEWLAVRTLVAAADTLMANIQLGASARMRPMVSRYGQGDFFKRHCDNHCDRGAGALCNGRLLSAVFYCTSAWNPGDGGCLRVFQPQEAPTGKQAPGGEPSVGPDVAELLHLADSDARADIAPVGGRLALFYSDYRVPHEVLPVEVELERFAVTLWYMDRIVEGELDPS